MSFLNQFESKDLPELETWKNEAKFGFSYVKKYLDNLPSNARVLEVGCGSGLLMGLIRAEYPNLKIDGIEPIGPGFAELDLFQKSPVIKELNIVNTGYEDYETDKTYDLIYLVNVFEHLPDWRDFITFASDHLTENGQCVVLCPNYGFPYESHFRLPIIFTKTLTHKVFAKRIAEFEDKHDLHGLWKSLNFVKLMNVKRELKEQDIEYDVKNSVVEDMIDRLDTDPEFAKRQKAISSFAKLGKKLGLIKLFNIGFIQNFMPYLLMEFGKSKRT